MNRRISLIGFSTFILAVSLACGLITGSDPTAVPPPTQVPATNAPPPTDVPPTNTPTPTAIPPTNTPLPTDVPTLAPPTDVPPPAYYTEEFESDTSFYPNEYLDFVFGGPDDFASSITINEGSLNINIDTEQTYFYTYYTAAVYKDVRIGMEADNLGSNSQAVSLMCRYDPEIGWLEVNLSGDGTYFIYAFVNGDGFTILFRGGTTAIITGQKTNTYFLECIGNTLSIYVNDKLIKELDIPDTYKTIDEGFVGFSISSFVALPVIVDIQWFSIEQP